MGNISTKIEMLLYTTKFTTHVLRADSYLEHGEYYSNIVLRAQNNE